MYAKEYRRAEILKNKLYFKEGWVELIYTNHALERLRERLRGEVVLYPKKVNISKLNIYKGYSYDDKVLHKIVLRLEFKPTEWIYLVVLPKNRVVKSLWFSPKTNNE